MNLPSISLKIKRLASLDMSVEALKALFLDLAAELDVEEARLSKERERKKPGVSTEAPRKLHGNGAEVPPSRVEDKTLPSLTSGKEESKNLPLSPSKPLPSDPDGFEEFWNLYPKREKNYDRKGAVKAFRAALKRIDFQTILDATRAYADYLKVNNKLNTEFVKQARSWLNGDFWTEFKPKPQGPIVNNKTYVKYGTDAGDAWQAHFKAKGKVAPKDFNDGWWFPTEYPETEKVTQ